MNEQNGVKETYLTIEEAAAYLKLRPQTIRKFVLNKTIPYHKIQKSVRFRLSEIERWIDRDGGRDCSGKAAKDCECDLFADRDTAEAGTGEPVGTETGESAANEAGAVEGARV